jgi:GNAT superfamily N-acetyltransferase
MRYLSKLGAGLNVLSRLNDFAFGISLGYVWIQDGRLVGNVSLYPANWPGDIGPAWIIANVAVHPDYQRRGIARRLMQASLDTIKQRGGKHAVLQVMADNTPAINLYHQLDFIDERNWTIWRRSSLVPAPPLLRHDKLHITQRNPREWYQEYALAEQIRPWERGGLGWLRPLHPAYFRQSLWQRFKGWMTLTATERLIIRSPERNQILASLWIERGGLTGNTRLTLMVTPPYRGNYDEALLTLAARRYRNDTLMIEHPTDEIETAEVLRRLRFQPRNTYTHMRRQLR